MSRVFVISGDNSGIGLEAGWQLVALGHHVILLGRHSAKGQAALGSLNAGPGSAGFHAVDLSTHAGCAAIAQRIAGQHPVIDGFVIGAGAMMTRDERIADGLHPVFSVLGPSSPRRRSLPRQPIRQSTCRQASR